MKTGENRARPDEGNTRNEERRRAMQRVEEREEWKPELRKRERDETRLMSSAPLSEIFGIKVHDRSMSVSEIAIEDEHPGERKRKKKVNK